MSINKDIIESQDDPITPKKTLDKDHEALLEKAWKGVTCGDLSKGREVVTIPSTYTITQASQVLAEHGITSAPVVDMENKRLIGFYDFRDLTAAIVAEASKPDASKKKYSVRGLLEAHFVNDDSDLSGHNKFHTVQTDSPLIDAVEYFGQGIHRVLVLNSEKQLTGVLSQTDALRYLNEGFSKELASLGEKKLGDLKLLDDRKPVVTINEDATVLDALKLLQEKNITSLALVRTSGELVANFSMTDVKYLLRTGRLEYLFRSIKQFVQDIRFTKDRDHEYKSQVPVFTCTVDTSLKNAVGKLLITKSHRVWVTRGPSDHHPAGVVSLSDILRVLTPAESVKKHWPLIRFVPAK